MVDLLVTNPTRDSLPTGDNINANIAMGASYLDIGYNVGSGSLTCFTSSKATASGSYSFDILGLASGNGDFNFGINQNSDGTWQVTITLTGTLSGNSLNFNASASQNKNTITFTNIQNTAQTVTISQNNGAPLIMSGRIDISISNAPISTIYIESN